MLHLWCIVDAFPLEYTLLVRFVNVINTNNLNLFNIVELVKDDPFYTIMPPKQI